MPGRKHQFYLTLSIVPIIATSLWLGQNAIASLSTSVTIPQQPVPAKPMTVLSQQLPVSLPQDTSGQRNLRQGNQIAVNGRILPVAWSQRQISGSAKSIRTGISDTGLMRTIGAELLSTWNITAQPVQWFSQPQTQPLILATWLTNQYRYVDITDLATAMGWQLQADGTTLQINLPPAKLQDIRQEQLLWPPNSATSSSLPIVADLDRPTPWQVSQEGNVIKVTIDAATDSAILQRTVPGNGTPSIAGEQGSRGDEENVRSNSSLRMNPICPSAPGVPCPSALEAPPPAPEICPIPQTPCPIKLESNSNQTTIRTNIPSGLRPRVWSLSNPYRLVIDFQPETMVERDIVWATGLRYRQQYIEIKDASSGKQVASRFPVVWLEINPRQPELTLKPIWSNPDTLVGIAPLIQTAQQWQAAAAINAGFFNRNTQLPLGAIRRDGRWLSSPILNRGAIAWNDLGEVKIGHLSLENAIMTSTGERLPVITVNSGYIQPGIALHTREWGTTYTPLSDHETIVAIGNNQVISQLPAGLAGQTPFPIPPDGYLLVIRGKPELADKFPIGTTLRYESVPVPAEFVRYPQILGAGPVLVQNRQIVLDAKAEQFRDAFIKESAVRSAIAITANNTLLIVTVGDRTGGTGPTLSEMAKIIQQMGAIDALNLDGGSSTSLYLGGQLLNRPPGTAARVHNGLGIFLNPR
jgi:exopolysaccharide biosynthesis protein